MWIPKKLVDWFGVNAELVRTMQADLAVATSERDNYRTQLAVTQNTLDWLRTRVNALELERAGLIEKAYNIKLPAPEIVRTSQIAPDMREFTFDDERETIAEKLGLAAAWDTN